jgi:hypothetical protein
LKIEAVAGPLLALLLVSSAGAQPQKRTSEAAKPINRLESAYSAYQIVQRCYEAMSVYIRAIQLERARRAVSAIEAAALAEDPSINSDEVWQRVARQRVRDEPAWCMASFTYLINAAPPSPPVKDFGAPPR